MGSIPIIWRLSRVDTSIDFFFFFSIHRHDTGEVADLRGKSPANNDIFPCVLA